MAVLAPLNMDSTRRYFCCAPLINQRLSVAASRLPQINVSAIVEYSVLNLFKLFNDFHSLNHGFLKKNMLVSLCVQTIRLHFITSITQISFVAALNYVIKLIRMLKLQRGTSTN